MTISLKKLWVKILAYCIDPTIKDDTLQAELEAVLGSVEPD